MGRDKVVDKAIRPLQAVTSLTPAQVANRRANDLGVLPIGVYKGGAAFIDLDKLANQPLAAVERLYSLDRLDDRDAVQAKIAAGASVGSKAEGQLTVPAGEVWLINRLEAVSPAESGAGVGDIVQVNIRVSSWKYPDARTGTEVNANGRSYWSADRGDASLNTYTIDLPAQGELGEELRLVGGDVLTLAATLTGATAGADLTATLTPYGRKVKKLVE
jgi:hypothetical protein